jgi:hypothetical protein
MELVESSKKAILMVMTPVVVETVCSPPAARYRQCAPLPQKHMYIHKSRIRDLATPCKIVCGRQMKAPKPALDQILTQGRSCS